MTKISISEPFCFYLDFELDAKSYEEVKKALLKIGQDYNLEEK